MSNDFEMIRRWHVRGKWDEIRKTHPCQWILVERPQVLTSGERASGFVIAHSRDRHALLPGHELEASRARVCGPRAQSDSGHGS